VRRQLTRHLLGALGAGWIDPSLARGGIAVLIVFMLEAQGRPS
jgi:hypothetical protein